MKPEAVIFDMDGTIIDNTIFHIKAWILFLAKYGIKIDSEIVNRQKHGTIQEITARFFELDVSNDRILELCHEKELTYRYLYKNHIKEVQGLTILLQTLKTRGIKIGLATMSDISNIDFTLDSLNVRNYFDCIIDGDDVSKGKPDPQIFISVAQKLCIPVNKCLVFEDSISGVTAAVRAKMKVVGITTSEKADELNKVAVTEQ